VYGVVVELSITMNVVGALFDFKIQWSFHFANAIKKSNSTLHATELSTLITANFYYFLIYLHVK
jgi:hypothetical protein